MKRWLTLLCGFGFFGSMAHATVTTTNFSVTYTCTGSVGPYTFSFPISAANALTVNQNGTVLSSSAYTITPINNNYENGGNVTLNASCPSPQTLVLERATPILQTTQYYDNMPVPTVTFMYNLDKLTEIAQEQSAEFGNFWMIPIYNSTPPSGACSPNNQVQYVTGSGAPYPQYTCISGIWVQTGGGGGSGTGLTQLTSDVNAGPGSGPQAATVKGLNGTPFCTGYTPTNGQAVTLTTASSPTPCYTAATAGASPGGSLTNEQYRVNSTTLGGMTSVYIPPSGDTTGATDQIVLQAAFTAACVGNPPAPISVHPGSGNFFFAGNFSIGCPFSFVGEGEANTNFYLTSGSHTTFALNYGGMTYLNGTTIISSPPVHWGGFSAQYYTGVTGTAGDLFNLSGPSGKYLTGVHIENIDALGLWGFVRTGSNMAQNWIQNNFCTNALSGGDGCLYLNTPSPGGDLNVVGNFFTGNSSSGITLSQGDVNHFISNKLNFSNFVFLGTGVTFNTLFTDNSFEGNSGSPACGVDFGTGSTPRGVTFSNSSEIGLYGTPLCHTTNVVGLNGCYGFQGTQTCVGNLSSQTQPLSSYTFYTVESPLSLGGTFVGALGDSPGNVPSSGVYEPLGTTNFYLAVNSGFGTWPNNQYQTIVIGAEEASSAWLILLRASTSVSSAYYLALDPATGCGVYAQVAGTAHQLGSTFSCTANTGDIWTMSVIGTSPWITVTQNSTQVFRIQDTTYGASLASGYPGFALRDTSSVSGTTITSESEGSL